MLPTPGTVFPTCEPSFRKGHLKAAFGATLMRDSRSALLKSRAITAPQGASTGNRAKWAVFRAGMLIELHQGGVGRGLEAPVL